MGKFREGKGHGVEYEYYFCGNLFIRFFYPLQIEKFSFVNFYFVNTQILSSFNEVNFISCIQISCLKTSLAY